MEEIKIKQGEIDKNNFVPPKFPPKTPLKSIDENDKNEINSSTNVFDLKNKIQMSQTNESKKTNKSKSSKKSEKIDKSNKTETTKNKKNIIAKPLKQSSDIVKNDLPKTKINEKLDLSPKIDNIFNQTENSIKVEPVKSLNEDTINHKIESVIPQTNELGIAINQTIKSENLQKSEDIKDLQKKPEESQNYDGDLKKNEIVEPQKNDATMEKSEQILPAKDNSSNETVRKVPPPPPPRFEKVENINDQTKVPEKLRELSQSVELELEAEHVEETKSDNNFDRKEKLLIVFVFILIIIGVLIVLFVPGIMPMI